MAIDNLPRLIAVSVLGIVLAAALGAQAVSSVSTRKMPSLAVSTFPANGSAREALIFENFSAAAAESGDPADAARQHADQAVLAIKSDPLVPKAYAILAIAQDDQAVRRDVLEASSLLNRRDLSLQSLLLQEHLSRQDYAKTIDTLDQILRVHPEYSPEFFPVLTDALAEPETIPLFADILDGSAPWHLRFLNYAVRQPSALSSLAVLRPDIASSDENFDKRLIASLAAKGDIEAAAELYRMVSGSGDDSPDSQTAKWASSYPPFDWQFVDEAGFRSQPSRDGEELELFARPGKGGLIAGRLLPAPSAPFSVRIEHDIKPAHQREDVNLQLTCTNTAQMVLDQTFDSGPNAFQVSSLPEACEFLVLAINARAWTGRSALRGTIDRIAIVPGS